MSETLLAGSPLPAERDADSGALPPQEAVSSAASSAEPSGVRITSKGGEAWQPKKLSGRQLVMIEYHLAGCTYKEIADHLGCTDIDVGLVIRGDLAQEYIRVRLGDMNQEFQGLFRKVIDVIDKSLDCADLEVAQKAADKWLRAHGRYSPKKDDSGALTAEDVIAKILERKGDVTVNIDARKQYSYRTEVDASA